MRAQIGDKVFFTSKFGDRVTGVYIEDAMIPTAHGEVSSAVVESFDAFGERSEVATRCLVPSRKSSKGKSVNRDNLNKLRRVALGDDRLSSEAARPGNPLLKAALDLWLHRGTDCGGPLAFEDWAVLTICNLVEVNGRQSENLIDALAKIPPPPVIVDGHRIEYQGAMTGPRLPPHRRPAPDADKRLGGPITDHAFRPGGWGCCKRCGAEKSRHAR